MSMSMHYDDQSTIVIAKNKTFNGKNRYVQLRHNVVNQLLKDEIISIGYVKSVGNLADPLMKLLGKKLIYKTSREMRFKPLETNK